MGGESGEFEGEGMGRVIECGWCRKTRWGNKVGKIRELEGRDGNFFSPLSFSAELTHTTYAAFVSMRFSALNYNWGITHAL